MHHNIAMYHIWLYLFCDLIKITFKGIVQPKMKILSSYSHPKKRYFKEYG